MNKNATSTTWDKLIADYYKGENKIETECSDCNEQSAWCNCTIKGIRQEQNYSIAVKVEETLNTKKVTE